MYSLGYIRLEDNDNVILVSSNIINNTFLPKKTLLLNLFEIGGKFIDFLSQLGHSIAGLEEIILYLKGHEKQAKEVLEEFNLLQIN